MIKHSDIINHIHILSKEIFGSNFNLDSIHANYLAINLQKHILRINNQCKNKIESVDDIFIAKHSFTKPDYDIWLIENKNFKYICYTSYYEDSNFYFNQGKYKDLRRFEKSKASYYNDYYNTVENDLNGNIKIKRIN